MRRDLAESAWPTLPSGTVVLVPVGSIEQHGPHLPLNTDTVIAEAVAHEVSALLDSDHVLVAPPIAYGASGEHQMFPGTSSIGTEALVTVIIELTRSLRTWAGRVVFINAHGGNVPALRRAVAQLIEEGHDVAWLPCATEEVDAHAGFTETSLMLHLRPWDVRLDHARAGNTAPLADLLPELLASGVGAVSANGVLGNPAGASAAEGERVLGLMACQIADQVLRMSRARATQPS
ncbi:mycofactocin biosynthesis peptidyl-dipeptidase MftE [Nocardioides sp. LS1]|uniref:mycofactocin biosynthesis peptidyl-dipeptidase MftE n=1 Tax=Nocardioides sp. LS1 TaxID=1027620 RepID=UPI000F61A688|nr:mycofactocin biosynthesis peptidyl-dipeptidase MftE [Nocardioides sp. LS1]GCD91096.1 mycofactocin system creatininase family protein [Nocardioides sp. LS1]